jgi:hypothetical protein
MVETELGPPALTTGDGDGDHANLAAWHVGSVLVVVGETQDEYISQGDVEHGAVWLFPHPQDEELPDMDELFDWLLQGKGE